LGHGGEDPSDPLHDAILKRGHAELRGVRSKVSLGEENQEGSIDPRELNGSIVEGGEES
jgi:hypothetical protein